MTVSGRIRGRVEAASAGTFFRPGDFVGSSSAVETTLSRLAHEGRLVRVRRGLYWKGVKSRFGSGSPGSLEVALELAGPKGVGPTGWTASHTLGLTTQVPPVVELAVAGRHAPKAPTGVRFHTRSNLNRVSLGFHEIAVLEVLRDWPAKTDCDWSSFAGTLEGLVKDKLVNLGRVKRSLAGEPPEVRKLFSSLPA